MLTSPIVDDHFRSRNSYVLMYMLTKVDDTSLFAVRVLNLFLTVSGLDLLDKLDVISEPEKKQMIEWIYSLQVTQKNVKNEETSTFGFKGNDILTGDHFYQLGEITFTYCALASLVILGDDFSRLDKNSILLGLKKLRNEDGSFCTTLGGEKDLRVLYCAAAISYMINDWSSFNKDRSEAFIRSCLTYEGGFGGGPGNESHGGFTYCALATLSLLDRLHEVLSEDEIDRVSRWCLFRQTEGFDGRTNKTNDSCYSFWVGSSLEMLGKLNLHDSEMNLHFLKICADHKGGFCKVPLSGADPLHTYFTLAALSVLELPLQPIVTRLNISHRSFDRLHTIIRESN